MPYLATADLLTRFGAEEIAQLADRGTPRLVTADLLAAAAAGADMTGWSPADVEAVDKAVAVVGQALEDAQSAVDGYLAGRYAMPLASVPPIVKRLACDMARYYLYDDNAPEAVQKRYDAAIAFFRDVSSGKASLDIAAAAQASTPGGTVQIVTSERVFSREARR